MKAWFSSAKKNLWIIIALGGIVLSLLSLFLPVIIYTTARGTKHSYNIVTLLSDLEGFIDTVFSEYSGSFLRGISVQTASFNAVIVSIIGVAAIVCAFVGIITMSQQYTNTKAFILSVCGLIGTAIPSIVLLSMVLMSQNYFPGKIRAGAYMFITPLAMIAACRAVTYKRKISLEEAKGLQYLKTPTDI